MNYRTYVLRFYKRDQVRRFNAPNEIKYGRLKDVQFSSNVPEKVLMFETVPLSQWVNQQNHTEQYDLTEYNWNFDSSAVDSDYINVIYRVFINTKSGDYE